MSEQRQCLVSLDGQLQELIDSITEIAEYQDWAALETIDQQVNQLVHTCIANGVVHEASIHRKVMYIARLYRSVIETLCAERDAAHQQLAMDKQQQKVANCYQVARNICA